jgi:hypothetical protein
MAGWDYKVEPMSISGDWRRASAKLEMGLNEQGKDGWELVGVIPTEASVPRWASGWSKVYEDAYTTRVFLLFKRPG